MKNFLPIILIISFISCQKSIDIKDLDLIGKWKVLVNVDTIGFGLVEFQEDSLIIQNTTYPYFIDRYDIFYKCQDGYADCLISIKSIIDENTLGCRFGSKGIGTVIERIE